MKKLSLLGVLLLVLVVAGCSWGSKNENAEENNVTKNELNVEVCDNYFNLVNCIIDNDTDAAYSQEERVVIKEAVNDMRESWTNLDDDSAAETCSTELNNLMKKFEGEEMTNYLANIGCPIN